MQDFPPHSRGGRGSFLKNIPKNKVGQLNYQRPQSGILLEQRHHINLRLGIIRTGLALVLQRRWLAILVPIGGRGVNDTHDKPPWRLVITELPPAKSSETLR
jgi:hypothetical protein